MKKIWNYLKTHLIVDFNPFYYGFIALFLTACIYYNYRVDFEDSFLDHQQGVIKFGYYFLTNLFAYMVPVLAYAFFYKNRSFLASPEFWVKSIAALAFLSFDRCSFFIDELVYAISDPKMYRWLTKIFNNLLGLFTMILPFLFI